MFRKYLWLSLLFSLAAREGVQKTPNELQEVSVDQSVGEFESVKRGYSCQYYPEVKEVRCYPTSEYLSPKSFTAGHIVCDTISPPGEQLIGIYENPKGADGSGHYNPYCFIWLSGPNEK